MPGPSALVPANPLPLERVPNLSRIPALDPGQVARGEEWRHTAMRGPVEVFKKFLRGLEAGEWAPARKAASSMDEAVDFLQDAMATS